MKLFCVLRNPVERTISAYQLLHQKFKGLTFKEAYQKDHKIIENGKYSKYLKSLRNLFPESNLKVMFYDDLMKSPKLFIFKLYEYLDVNPEFIPVSLEKKYNKIIYPKLQQHIYQLKLDWIIDFIKKTPIDIYIRELYSKKSITKTHGVTKDDLDYLKKEFREDINALSNMYGRDLSHWVE